MPNKSRPPKLHPAQRFAAPNTIQQGIALADLMGPQAVKLLAESMVDVAPSFDAKQFSRRALGDLEGLGLMQRGQHVATALAEQLPAGFDQTAEILVASLGPELQATEGNGLAPFFYLPHSCLIATQGVRHFQQGMRACYELTKRFTAEFCIRAFLAEHQRAGLAMLATWASDPNPHVRRLVSEGSRPRLPWGKRLTAFQQDPLLTLPLLERLKDDPAKYVQRSVANHLGDLLKDNPDVAFATCERWIGEVSKPKFDPARAKARLWVVRHALRNPAKKGVPQALRLRKLATR